MWLTKKLGGPLCKRQRPDYDAWFGLLASSYGLIAITIAVVQNTSTWKQSVLLAIYLVLLVILYLVRGTGEFNYRVGIATTAVAVIIALTVVNWPTAPSATYFVVDATEDATSVFAQLSTTIANEAENATGKVGLLTYGRSQTSCEGFSHLVYPSRVPEIGARIESRLRESPPAGQGSLAIGLRNAAEELKHSRGNKSVTAVFVRPSRCGIDGSSADEESRMAEVIANWPSNIAVRLESVGFLSVAECNVVKTWATGFQQRGVSAGHTNGPVETLGVRLRALTSYTDSYFNELVSVPMSPCAQ